MISPAAAALGAIPEAATLTGQPAHDARPQDLFAALMNLLSALPLPLPLANVALPEEAAPEQAEAEPADESEAAPLAPEPAALAALAALHEPPAPRASDAPAPRAPELVPTRALTLAPHEDAAALRVRFAPAALVEDDAPVERTPEGRSVEAALPAPAAGEAPLLTSDAQPILPVADTPPAAPVAPRELLRAFSVDLATKTAPQGPHHLPRELPVAPRPEHGLDPAPLELAPPVTRSELSAASIPREPAPIDGPPRVTPAESARPVIQNVVFLAEHGGGSARMTLNPPELGPVEIVVRVRGKQVEVHVRAEETAAQQVVRDSRDSLSEALASRELRMDGFSVGSGGAGSTGNQPRDAARESDPQMPAPSVRVVEARSISEPALAPSFLGAPSGAIDLRV